MDYYVNAASEMVADAPSKVPSKIGYNSASKVAFKWKASRESIDGFSRAVLEVEVVNEAPLTQLSLKHLLVLLKSQWNNAASERPVKPLERPLDISVRYS